MWTIIKKNVDLKGKRKNNSKVYISMYLKTRIYAFLGKTFFSPVARGVDGLDFLIKPDPKKNKTNKNYRIGKPNYIISSNPVWFSLVIESIQEEQRYGEVKSLNKFFQSFYN
jgi:hypothetical protein